MFSQYNRIDCDEVGREIEEDGGINTRGLKVDEILMHKHHYRHDECIFNHTYFITYPSIYSLTLSLTIVPSYLSFIII